MDNTQCIVPGIEHSFQFSVAEYGYQCFVCDYCGWVEDVAEDFAG